MSMKQKESEDHPRLPDEARFGVMDMGVTQAERTPTNKSSAYNR